MLKKHTPRVAITTTSFATADMRPNEALTKAGLEVRCNPYGRSPDETEMIELLRDAVGVLAGTAPLNERVLSGAPGLRVISRVGTGLDNVDLAAAHRDGIRVYNTPEAPAEAVAELTLGLILGALRRIYEADRSLRAGSWQPLMGHLLRDKTVGIIGVGHVGRRVIQLLEPFGVKVLGVDPVLPPTDFIERYHIEVCSLDRALAQSDVVSLHLPAVLGLGAVVDDAALKLMKSTAVLVNTARGSLVDESALVDALQRRAIAGAALDTFDVEPYEGPLRELPNVLMTCHMGSYAAECRSRMELDAVHNLLEGLRLAGVLQ